LAISLHSGHREQIFALDALRAVACSLCHAGSASEAFAACRQEVLGGILALTLHSSEQHSVIFLNLMASFYTSQNC